MPHIEQSQFDDDEIDLLALLASLWRGKLLIFATIVCCVAGAIAYLQLFAVPKYQASAVFAFESGNGGLNLGEFGGLAALAGLGGGLGGNGGVLDQISERDFLVLVVTSLNLTSDPEINSYLRPASTYSLGAVLKGLGFGSDKNPTTAEMLEHTITVLKNDVISISETKEGSFRVSVSSEDPVKAALIANTVVELFLDLRIEAAIAKSKKKLQYLARELSVVQGGFETAAADVERFTLSANILSQARLMEQSVRMVDMRERIAGLEIILEALGSFKTAVGPEAIDALTFEGRLEKLTQVSPQLSHKLLLEFSGGAAQASILEIIALEKLRLSQAKLTLERNLGTQEKTARITARDATELRRLKQRLAIEKTTYEVFVEQFKGQSLLGGYQVALGEVYKTAMPPLRVASPKKSLVVALAAVLGLFFSSGLVLLGAVRRGLVWSEANLKLILPGFEIFHAPPRWFKFVPRLILDEHRRLSQAVRRSVGELQSSFLVAVAGAKSGLFLVVPLGKGQVDAMTGVALGQALIANGKTVAYLNLDPIPTKEFDDIKKGAAVELALPDGLAGWTWVKGCDYFCFADEKLQDRRFDANNLFIYGHAEQAIKSLLEQYAFVVVLAPNYDSHPAIIRILGLADRLFLSAQYGRFTQHSCTSLAGHLDAKQAIDGKIIAVPA